MALLHVVRLSTAVHSAPSPSLLVATHVPAPRSKTPAKIESVTLAKRGRWIEEILSFFEAYQANQKDSQDYCVSIREHIWGMLLTQQAGFTSELRELLQEHYQMHQSVAEGRPQPNQTYLIWSLSGGLGNRFQALASTFVAALLSKRVLLLKDWFTPLPANSKHNKPMIFSANYTTEYAMEALEKLFWSSNPTVVETNPRPPNSELLCPIFPMMSLTEFYAKYPDAFENEKTHRVQSSRSGHVKIDISARHDAKLLRWSRFACAKLDNHCCDTDFPSGHIPFDRFFPEKFVYVWTNQYYLPLLFANPHHGATLRRLLPVKPFSTLVRLLVIPSHGVMRRVASFFDNQRRAFPSAPLLPGTYDALQVRAFSFKEMPALAAAFHTCYRKPSSPFFLATMHDDIRSNFEQKYNASLLRVLSTKVAGDQMTGKGISADVEALVDMLLLALGRRVLLSAGSTFGVFSAAYGELPAVRVNWKASHAAPGDICEPMTSDQPCFGSWHKYDHLMQRSNLGSGRLAGNDIPCTLLRLPEGVMSC